MAGRIELRHVLAWASGAGWCWLLWRLVEPWMGLGGLVDERLRWLVGVALGGGALLGWTGGELARPAAVVGKPEKNDIHGPLPLFLVLLPQYSAWTTETGFAPACVPEGTVMVLPCR